MEHTALLWFGLMVVFILVEASTVTMLSVWFVIGALAAMVTSLLGGEIWLQAVIFLAVSAVMLLALRPLARKYITPKIVKTNVDSVVDSVGRVTEAIDNVDSVYKPSNIRAWKEARQACLRYVRRAFCQ